MLTDLPHYYPADSALWQGRKDSLSGERFFQHVNCVDVRTFSLKNTQKPVLLGFCCEEGIRRNEGRLGAKEGPDQLRHHLAQLSCHTNASYLDIGNIVCPDDDLESAQEQLSQLLSYCHQQPLKTIAFGGGHEIAWAHFKGLTSHYPKLGIINFDAHFDLRPLKDGAQGTSGTPFFQIHDYCQQQQRPFNYCCLGIQPTANTKSLYHRAEEFKVRYLTAEQMNEKTFAWQTAFLDEFLISHDHIYLTICLDVFADSAAPGVSAPQTLGLTPWQVIPLLKYIAQTGKVVSIDVAELSPPLDTQHKTARLAAAIVAELLNLN